MNKIEMSYNGLKVTIFLTPGYETKHVFLCCKFGSKDVILPNGEQIPYGTAHFLEHKLLMNIDGTDGFDTLNSYGVEANAYTTVNRTVYFFSGLKIEQPLIFLLQKYFSPCFTEKDIKKEKKIIANEIKMVNDNPYEKIFQKMRKIFYSNKPIGYPIAGDLKELRKTTLKDLYDAYNSFYTNDNSHLIIVGDIDIKRINSILKQYIPKRNNKIIFNEKRTYEEKQEKKVFLQGELTKDFYVFTIRINKNNLSQSEIFSLNGYIDQIFNSYSSLYEKLISEKIINSSYTINTFYDNEVFGYSIASETNDARLSLKKLKKFIKNKISPDRELEELYLKRTKASIINLEGNPEKYAEEYINEWAKGNDLEKIIDEIFKQNSVDYDLAYDLLKNSTISVGILKKLK